jgi:hypothetical protein
MFIYISKLGLKTNIIGGGGKGVVFMKFVEMANANYEGGSVLITRMKKE